MHQSRMFQKLYPEGGRLVTRRQWRRLTLVLMIMLLPGLLGAWRVVSGDTIDSRRVSRIKDGKTTKQEILLLFGDPQEIDRTPEGVVYLYKNFKDAPAFPYRHEKREISPQSDQVFIRDDKKQIKKAPLKTEGTILKSTLLIRFKPDGETVMSHEFKEF